jgi:uncharacterized CHY-type Zn-finger protein
MPRIRYLKPEFFSDEDLADLPFETRIFYAGLWCYADREGRLEDRPKYLKAVIFPYDRVDIEKMISTLCQCKNSGDPFIQRYEVGGKQYIQILTWEKHQHPHHSENPSSFPPAPPLNKEKDKDKGKGNKLEPSNDLNTVKERLKNRYGEFQNVFLTDEELTKLNEQFSELGTKERIENLSRYLASKGKKYNSHYATILSWERKNNPGFKISPLKTAKKPVFRCPKCQKETTEDDLKKFESCPACFKPLGLEKLSELTKAIGH